MTGLTVVYTYFQIPLMVIVFLPALDGLRQEWYDASASLGGSSWSFWRHVGGPILAPSFLGAVLLLFANAFSAYATAAALVSQGSPDRAAPDPRGDVERGGPRTGEHRQGPGPGDDRHRRGRHGALCAAPAPSVAVAAMTTSAPPSRADRSARWAILVLVGGYLLLPLRGDGASSRRAATSAAGRSTPGSPSPQRPEPRRRRSSRPLEIAALTAVGMLAAARADDDLDLPSVAAP